MKFGSFMKSEALTVEQQNLLRQALFDDLVALSRSQNVALQDAEQEIDRLRGQLNWHQRLRGQRSGEPPQPLLAIRVLVWTVIAFGWPSGLVLYLQHYPFDAGAIPYFVGTLIWLAGIGIFANEWVIKGGRKK